MPKKKKAEVVGTVEAPEVVVSASVGQDPTPVGTVVNKKTSFDVYNPGGALVRTYSVETHGKDAENLANEYANKIGGKVV